jgi:hypothetical protein
MLWLVQDFLDPLLNIGSILENQSLPNHDGLTMAFSNCSVALGEECYFDTFTEGPYSEYSQGHAPSDRFRGWSIKILCVTGRPFRPLMG